jgi:hypothetical protein
MKDEIYLFIQIVCRISAMILFSYLTDFSYFPLKLFSESCWTWSEQVKNDHFDRGVDGFSYFSLILVILFSNQDHPWNIKHRPFTL